MPPAPMPAPTMPALALWSLRAVASFVGVFGFASMFNTPAKMAGAAGIIGLVVNLGRIGLIDIGTPIWAATAVAALCVGLGAAWLGKAWNMPPIILSVPATLIMVPGAAAFRSLIYFSQGQAAPTISNLATAVFTVTAIAMGLAVARMLTDRRWMFDRRVPLGQ
jgi:uncharacterized membrane protein YjjB (DUF3815 family)